MVVAVIAIGKMQMAVDEIVNVIAMRDRLVAAVGAMDMGSIVAAAVMALGAAGGVRLAYFHHMLIDMAFMRAMQVAVVEVVDVVVMLDCGMTAVGAMLVRMVLVDFVIDGHRVVRPFLCAAAWG